MSKLSLEEQNRPKRWIDYVGQGQGQGGPVDYLKTVIRYNRHPKAIWCCGSPGCGKSSLAMLYTRSTLCPHRPEGTTDSCGICDVCLGVTKDNIEQITVGEASVFKEEVPKIIEAIHSLPHTTADRADQFRRFIIIDECENASRAAMSALLGPLEFGPASTTVVLLSMDPGKLDPILREAIESRCKQLSLSNLSEEQITTALLGKTPNLNGEAAKAIAHFAKGNMRRAWSRLDWFLTMHAAEDINADMIYNTEAGGAAPSTRKVMWKALQQGDAQTVKTSVSQWIIASNPLVIADLLMADLVADADGSKTSLELMSDLGQWYRMAYKPDLLSILLPYLSVDICTTSSGKSNIKEVENKEEGEDKDSTTLAILSTVNKGKGDLPPLFASRTFKELIYAHRKLH